MVYNPPIFSQHDGRWQGQRLGTVNGATIGLYGCLITCLTMMYDAFGGHNLFPNNVDDIFTNQGGYASGDLVIWGRIPNLLPGCAPVGSENTPNTPANIAHIKQALDQGELVILEVRWHGNANMQHYVLAVDYNGNDIIVNDPETGSRVGFSSKYFGTGNAATDIVSSHYYANSNPGKGAVSAPAAAPAATPAPAGIQAFQRKVIATAKANYRSAPNTSSNIIKQFDPSVVLDFKGFVHGQNIDGNDVWFVGKETGGYIWSGDCTDTGTHDLADLTPQEDPAVIAQLQAQVTDLQNQLNQAHDLLNKQGDTINGLTGQVKDLTDKISKTEAWQHTYKEDRKDRLTVVVGGDPVTITDFENEEPNRQIGNNVLVEQAGTFIFDGIEYARTVQSEHDGVWYGIPTAILTAGTTPKSDTTGGHQTPEQLAELQTQAIALSSTQQFNAAAAGQIGAFRSWVNNIGNLFGGKK